MESVGMMRALSTSRSSELRRVITFLTMASCSSRSPLELMRSWRMENTCALARVSSMGACVPSSTRALVSEYSFSAEASVSSFYLDVLVQRHQIGVKPHHAVHGGDELLLEQ